MKLYLLALLLCLLLDNSLSARLKPPSARPNPSSTKTIYKFFRSFYKWGKRINNLENTIQPNAREINGMSSIKQYLSEFGYLLDSGPFNDSLDKETVSAIKTYQQYFNLQVTGDLNHETLHQISLPRCAVPDMNFDSSMIENVSWPKEGNAWFPRGKRNLTYGFLPASEIPENATKVFKDSFMRWAQAIKVLNLTEAMYDDADIKIGFYNFSDGVEDEMYGGSIIRLQPYDKKTGEIRMDGNKYWALPVENDSLSWKQSVLDMESVAVHEIGHLMGLDHTSKNDSVMYPTILPSQQRKVQLSDYDKQQIQHQFTNTADAGRWGFQITALSLLFVCVAFFSISSWLSSLYYV